MYTDTLNFELNVYYGSMWDNNTIDKYRERMENYFNRIQKYMTNKKKPLLFEHGCYNMNITSVELSTNYELYIFLGDGKRVNITLEDLIVRNTQMRYDSKVHSIYFINT